MKSIRLVILALLLGLVFIASKAADNSWIVEKHNGYNLMYKSIDDNDVRVYDRLVASGIASVESFFNSPYKKKFDVFIHPSRHSLDSTWQKDWNMPDFKSECWMAASGIAAKLDVISPKRWDKETCEHKYADTLKTQQLFTHELVHVYHGQQNASPDFSNVEGIDWFVEGLATYVSGQCDSLRLAEVKNAVANNKIPKSLDDFWTGKLRYGLSGSIVMYIDKKYGRSVLMELLPLSRKSELLSVLKTTEPELVTGWKSYIQNQKGI